MKIDYKRVLIALARGYIKRHTMATDEGAIVGWATNESGEHYPIHEPQGDAQGDLFTGKFKAIVGKSKREAAARRAEEKQAKEQERREAAERRKEKREQTRRAREEEKERKREEKQELRAKQRRQKELAKETNKINKLYKKEAAGTLTAKEKKWLEENAIPF